MIPRQRPAHLAPRVRAARVPVSARVDPAERRDPALLLQELIQPPDRLDEIAGLRVAARSRSAESAALDLGGDWYVAARLPDGDAFLALGDAVGHGLGAAEAMVRLRFAMAAFAAEGHRPATVLSRLNSLMCWADTGVTASAAAARYSPHDGVLTWANAGHLPFLLAGRGGVRQVPGPDGVLLGVTPSARYAQRTLRLEQGDMMLMYTDGLIPHGQSLDDGVSALLEQLAGSPRAPQAVLDRLDYGASHDDASALAAQRIW
ncbi:MAG TPA: PP2C family protein-serine/threonine phosphatase [Actinocrinis sp.]|nr:PP2C family protein-serine/threonine phosphatase [Actinocrinis sp.]